MSLTHSRELKSNELRAHRLLDRAIYYLLSLLLRSIVAKHLKPKIDNRSIELSGEEEEEFAIRSWKTARYTTIVRRKKQVIRFRVPSLLDHRARRDTVKTRGLRRTPVLSLSGFVKFVISQSARAFPAAPRGRTCVDAATNAPPVYATSSRIINGRIRIPRSREKSDR